MTYGLRILNPGGEIVIDSEAKGYRYHSSPAPSSPASMDGFTHIPYIYLVTTGSSTDIPIVFVKPELNKAVKIAEVTLISGTTWQILVYGVNISSYNSSMRNALMAVPTIYVFTRMNSSGLSYGLQLFDSAMNCTYDSNYKPLWLKGAIAFTASSGSYTHPTGWAYTGGSVMGYVFGNFNYDQQTFGGYSTLAVLGNTMGGGEVGTVGTSGESADIWEYGWTLINGKLGRHRFWVGTNKSSYYWEDGADAGVYFDLPAMTAICIEAAGL